jgi:hypothetical protein
MARRRYSDHDAIRKSLLTECPRCHYMIPPAELSRPGQDWNLVRCPKCQHEFIVPQKATRRISNHADDYFFLSSVLAVIVVVFVGFTPTYYLAPVFHAPALPSVIVHLHGAVFTGWILLLLVQCSWSWLGVDPGTCSLEFSGSCSPPSWSFWDSQLLLLHCEGNFFHLPSAKKSSLTTPFIYRFLLQWYCGASW